MNIQKEIIDYLVIKAAEKGFNVSNVTLNTRYLDEGILDSLGLILMIDEFEQKFNIIFSTEDLQSYEFQDIAGLTLIVEKRLNSEK